MASIVLVGENNYPSTDDFEMKKSIIKKPSERKCLVKLKAFNKVKLNLDS